MKRGSRHIAIEHVGLAIARAFDPASYGHRRAPSQTRGIIDRDQYDEQHGTAQPTPLEMPVIAHLRLGTGWVLPRPGFHQSASKRLLYSPIRRDMHSG